jgi:hypothetical protein
VEEFIRAFHEEMNRLRHANELNRMRAVAVPKN